MLFPLWMLSKSRFPPKADVLFLFCNKASTINWWCKTRKAFKKEEKLAKYQKHVFAFSITNIYVFTICHCIILIYTSVIWINWYLTNIYILQGNFKIALHRITYVITNRILNRVEQDARYWLFPRNYVTSMIWFVSPISYNPLFMTSTKIKISFFL